MFAQTKVKTLVHQALKEELLMTFHTDLAFETVSELAEGGMGKIYRVRDRRLDREAALKVLRAGRTDKDSTLRFLREARITAQLSHPAIPPVYEAGITPEGCPYLLMKLIEGRTLSDCIYDFHNSDSKSPEAMRPLIVALLRAAEAVAYAHSQGVIHRDLKPDNIMIGDFGEVLVLDWGLAKEKAGTMKDEALFGFDPSASHHIRPGLTVKGNILGTASYMAPEQAKGEDIDEGVDIFALGAILCEILTGHPPIEGDSAFVLLVRASEGIISTPVDYDPKANPELAAISAAALSADRESRPKSLNEFVHWLQCYLEKKPVPIYNYSMGRLAVRKVQKHPTFMFGLVVLLFLFLVGGLFAELLSTRRLVEILGSQADRSQERLELDAVRAEALVRHSARKIDLLADLRSMAKRKQFGPEFRRLVKLATGLDRKDQSFRLQIAELCRQGGLYKEARVNLLEMVANHPPAYEALFCLYQIDHETGIDLGAEETNQWLAEISRRSKQSDERNAFVFFAEAYNAQQRKDDTQALRLYNAAESHCRDIPALYNNRGKVKISLGDPLGALEDLTRALKLRPRYYQAMFNRATAYKDLSQWQSALRGFTDCIKVNPNYDKGYTNRGAVYSHLGQQERALIDFNKAIQLNSKTVLGFSNRGNYYANKGRWQAALDDYNRALKNDPLFALGYLKRGATRARLGKPGFVRDYERFLELDPTHALAPRAQAMLQEARALRSN